MQNNSKIDILIIESDKLVTDEIIRILDSQKYETKVINEGKVAFDFLLDSQNEPDIVLIGFNLNTYTGIELVIKIFEAGRKFSFVYIAEEQDTDRIIDFIRAGALSFVRKNSDLQNILEKKISDIYCKQWNHRQKILLETQIQTSEEKYRLVLDDLSDAVLVTDLKGKILDCNLKASKLFDYNKSELLQSNIFELDFISNDDFCIELFQNSEFVYKNHIKTKSGKLFPAEISGKKYRTNDGTIFYLYISDITQKRQLEEQIKTKNFVMETAINAIALANPDGILIYCNPSFLKIWGYSSANEVLGKHYSDFWTYPVEIKDMVQSKQSNNSFFGEVIIRNTFGNELILKLSAGVVNNHDDSPVYFVNSFIDITGERALSMKLLESQELIDSTLKSIDDLIFVINPEGIIKGYYQTYSDEKRILKPESLVGKHYNKVLSVSVAENFLQAAKLLKQTEKTQQIEYQIKYGSTIKYYNAKISGQYDQNKNISAYTVAISNITSQKEAELKLKASEEKFAGIFNLNPFGIVISTIENGLFFEANQSFTRIVGYSLDEIIGKSVIELDLYKDYNERVRMIETIQNQGKVENFEVTLRKKDGTFIRVLMASTHLVFNNLNCLLTVVTDITERAKNEDKYKKLFHALEFSPSIFVISNPLGEIEYVNPKFTQSTGYTFEEVIGRNPKFLNSGNQTPDFYHNLWDTIRAGKEWKGVFRNKKKDGTYYWEKASISAIFDYQGDIVNFIKVSEDYTSQREMEDNLRISEQELRKSNALKDKMFSIIGHDLRGPIGNSLSLLNLIHENPDLLDKEMIAILRNSASSTFDLLENLLFWAKSQKGGLQFEPALIKLNHLVIDIIDLLKASAAVKSIDLISMIDNEVIVYADDNMLRTILRNLVTNAIKFTPINGKVYIMASVDNSLATITVKDTGVGIKAEKLELILQNNEIYTTYGTEQEKGSGLGLIVCKEFVHINGGEISVKSKEGDGAEFIFTLPLKTN